MWHKQAHVLLYSLISNGDECSYPDSFHPSNVRDTFSIHTPVAEDEELRNMFVSPAPDSGRHHVRTA